MTIGQAIKKGFSVAGSSRTLLAVFFGFGFFWNLINVALSTRIPADDTPPDGATLAMMAVAGILFVLMEIFFQGGSLNYVKENIKTGSNKLSAFIQGGQRYYISVLAVAMVVTGVVVLMIALIGGIATLLGETNQVIAAVIALAIAALGITFVLLVLLAPYIVVADNVPARKALAQSPGLVKQNLGVLIGVSLLLLAIGFGVGMVLGGLLTALGFAVQGLPLQIITALLSSAVNAYLRLVVSGSFMAFYLSLPKTANANNN